MDEAKIIAFYLPQFHPIEQNNIWWEPGFTEWTNVCKAKKLFPGHYQPKLPGELGFYDLRLPEIRAQQAQLAKDYGIDAFCYYYYRLNPNLHIMEKPLNAMFESKEPNFPFMLCWANHNWSKKLWNSDKGSKEKILAIQEYGDEQYIEDYFFEILPYFKDERYLKQDNQPLFSIYSPLSIPNVQQFISIWNKLAIENGFSGVKFIGYTEFPKDNQNKILAAGFSYVNSCHLYAIKNTHSLIKRYAIAFWRRILKQPYIVPYKKASDDFITENEKNEKVCPTIIPNWDRSPRRGRYCEVYKNATPELFKKHVDKTLDTIAGKENKLIFVKSWNEWGEGNYLEPDRKWGRRFLEALKQSRTDKNL